MKLIMKIGMIVLLITVVLSMGCANAPAVNTPLQTTTPVSTVNIPISEQNVAKYDFEGSIQYSIGRYYEAPPGYQYVIIGYTVQNDGNDMVNTNPNNWKFLANGVVYGYDSCSHSDEINHMTVDIGSGGSFSSTLVFVVPSGVTRGILKYSSYSGVKLYQDKSLIEN